MASSEGGGQQHHQYIVRLVAGIMSAAMARSAEDPPHWFDLTKETLIRGDGLKKINAEDRCP